MMLVQLLSGKLTFLHSDLQAVSCSIYRYKVRGVVLQIIVVFSTFDTYQGSHWK